MRVCIAVPIPCTRLGAGKEARNGRRYPRTFCLAFGHVYARMRCPPAQCARLSSRWRVDASKRQLGAGGQRNIDSECGSLSLLRTRSACLRVSEEPIRRGGEFVRRPVPMLYVWLAKLRQVNLDEVVLRFDRHASPHSAVMKI